MELLLKNLKGEICKTCLICPSQSPKGDLGQTEQ